MGPAHQLHTPIQSAHCLAITWQTVWARSSQRGARQFVFLPSAGILIAGRKPIPLQSCPLEWRACVSSPGDHGALCMLARHGLLLPRLAKSPQRELPPAWQWGGYVWTDW